MDPLILGRQIRLLKKIFFIIFHEPMFPDARNLALLFPKNFTCFPFWAICNPSACISPPGPKALTLSLLIAVPCFKSSLMESVFSSNPGHGRCEHRRRVSLLAAIYHRIPFLELIAAQLSDRRNISALGCSRKISFRFGFLDRLWKLKFGTRDFGCRRHGTRVLHNHTLHTYIGYRGFAKSEFAFFRH